MYPIPMVSCGFVAILEMGELLFYSMEEDWTLFSSILLQTRVVCTATMDSTWGFTQLFIHRLFLYAADGNVITINLLTGLQHVYPVHASEVLVVSMLLPHA